jgi:hypothetical protein
MEFEALPLPEFPDPRFAYYAVRLDGDGGYWPARLIEGRTTPLCHSDSAQKRIYPPSDPGRRHPKSKYETPDKNIIVNARLKDGSTRPMYLADVIAMGLPHTGQVNVERRCWERIDENDFRYFEDPKAAAMTSWKRVVEVVGWCPLTQDDEHGYPAQHGEIAPVGEKVPGTGKVSDGSCFKCGTNVERRRQALNKIRALLKVGV